MEKRNIAATVSLRPEAMERTKARLRGAVRKIQQHRISIGIHEEQGGQSKVNGEGDGESITLAEVATAHEFGTDTLPERSWLRSWVDQNRPALERQMAEAMRKEYEGDRTAVERQANIWATSLQAWILTEQAHLTSLKPETIQHKQEEGMRSPETPLFATGQIIEAIRAHLDGRAL